MADTWAESDLKEHDNKMDEYEKKCPVCDMCKDPITWTDYYYNVDDRVICPDCTDRFLEYYRKSVQSFIDRR